MVFDTIIDDNDVVNMEVFTSLKDMEFSDQFDLLSVKKLGPIK